ncbi:MAG: hypothetical protein RR420_08180 [Anaerovoracaceae bacterium]
MKRINQNEIKIFMAIIITVDSFGFLLPTATMTFFTMLMPCVTAWFAFNSVDSMIHTSSLKNYFARLFFLGIMLLIEGSIIEKSVGSRIFIARDNVVLTIAISLLAIALIFFYKPKTIIGKFSRLVLIVTALASGFLCKSGYMVLPFMFITYIFFNEPRKRNNWYVLLSAILLFTSIDYSQGISDNISILAKTNGFLFILVIIFIEMYNGERGKKSQAFKWSFYIYYLILNWALLYTINGNIM